MILRKLDFWPSVLDSLDRKAVRSCGMWERAMLVLGPCVSWVCQREWTTLYSHRECDLQKSHFWPSVPHNINVKAVRSCGMSERAMPLLWPCVSWVCQREWTTLYSRRECDLQKSHFWPSVPHNINVKAVRSCGMSERAMPLLWPCVSWVCQREWTTLYSRRECDLQKSHFWPSVPHNINVKAVRSCGMSERAMPLLWPCVSWVCQREWTTLYSRRECDLQKSHFWPSVPHNINVKAVRSCGMSERAMPLLGPCVSWVCQRDCEFSHRAASEKIAGPL